MFLFFLVFAMSLYASIYMCFVVPLLHNSVLILFDETSWIGGSDVAAHLFDVIKEEIRVNLDCMNK